MKIVQINPGILPIPPNGWGAVEKIIWEYSLIFKKMGHEVDIKYLNDIDTIYDIVHVHMANLAIELKKRGIPYIFSMHDHHVVWFGKDSNCFKKNLEAIEGSLVSFAHAKFLINYFNSSKLIYLEHGVNIEEYKYIERSFKKPQLLCLANNGILENQSYDRKGFRYAIEAARELGLSITVAGPKNNENFFNENLDLNYENLNIVYDLDQDESVKIFSSHDIFLHLSDLEAGHPNLTLLEAASTGMPIVGCMENEMPGLIPASREKDSVIDGIKKVIDAYPIISKLSRENAELHSWEVVVSKMLEHYQNVLNWNMAKKLVNSYTVTHLVHRDKKDHDPFIAKFNLLPDYIKINTEISIPAAGVSILYKKGNVIKNFFDHRQDSRRWSSVSHRGEWVDWNIVIKNGSKVLKEIKNELKDKLVGISIEKDFDIDILQKFKIEKECILVLIGNFNNEQVALLREYNIYFYDKAECLDYWYSWSTILNWNDSINTQVEPNKEKTLLYLRSKALGDTIAFVESCREWKEKHNQTPTLAINLAFIDIFKSYDLEFIGHDFNPCDFSDIIVSDYHFEGALQHGFQQDLGLDATKRFPDLKFKPSIRPIQGRYVCIGTHSTAQAKMWNYPDGWDILCRMLRKENITPVCIDRYERFGTNDNWNDIPKSSVKKVGMKFPEIMNFLHHSELFIGLSSGLSWLAHGLGKKTVMITGPTAYEFEQNNYKVQNTNVCHRCFHSPDLHKFDPTDWMWCPVHKNTERHHECTKTITPIQVFNMIMSIINTEKHE